MKHTADLKRLFCLIISLSLVFTSMPAGSFMHSCLAPPGEINIVESEFTLTVSEQTSPEQKTAKIILAVCIVLLPFVYGFTGSTEAQAGRGAQYLIAGGIVFAAGMLIMKVLQGNEYERMKEYREYLKNADPLVFKSAARSLMAEEGFIKERAAEKIIVEFLNDEEVSLTQKNNVVVELSRCFEKIAVHNAGKAQKKYFKILNLITLIRVRGIFRQECVSRIQIGLETRKIQERKRNPDTAIPRSL